MTIRGVPQKRDTDAKITAIYLDRVPQDEEVEVLDIPEGRRPRRSLEQIGIRVREKLRVIKTAPLGGPVLVEVRGSMVALGRSLARRIRVRVIRSV